MDQSERIAGLILVWQFSSLIPPPSCLSQARRSLARGGSHILHLPVDGFRNPLQRGSNPKRAPSRRVPTSRRPPNMLERSLAVPSCAWLPRLTRRHVFSAL